MKRLNVAGAGASGVEDAIEDTYRGARSRRRTSDRVLPKHSIRNGGIFAEGKSSVFISKSANTSYIGMPLMPRSANRA